MTCFSIQKDWLVISLLFSNQVPLVSKEVTSLSHQYFQLLEQL
jgi:hypothetical protein